MDRLTRRDFLGIAAACGAGIAWGTDPARSTSRWQERHDLYPQGVASGDPYPTACYSGPAGLTRARLPPTGLTVEIAEDPEFHRVVSQTTVDVAAATDWTCRVLAVGLQPSRFYWYRFADPHGFASRVGRTRTAPALTDERPVRLVFVSCQNMQLGSANAYRRMIWDDQHRDPADQIGFVLHLGDFVYEIVWYPEDRAQGMYSRRIRDLMRYPNGEPGADFQVPTTVEDYRALYAAYLLDLDLQDARARWPFIYMWDNHEFSWRGWQSQENFGSVRPAQTRKVAANQAWFEYQPARVSKPDRLRPDRFSAPAVADAPIREFDSHGLGLEPGNLTAIRSLEVFRTLRWGKNVELLLTDNRSFRSEPVTARPEAAPFRPTDFPYALPQDVLEVLDAGRTYRQGPPPDTIVFNGAGLPNPREDASPQTTLGATQKAWFLDRLRRSTAPWKLWGNSIAMLDWRTDFQNLPAEMAPRWPGTGYALFTDDDWPVYRAERAEILEFIRTQGITGLVNLSGDRHAFTAGVLSAALPPQPFRPVGAEFITGSISAPGLAESAEYNVPRDHPLRSLYTELPNRPTARTALNVCLRHGVRSRLALHQIGDPGQALAAGNPDVAPHLGFVDVGGHGFSVVRVTRDAVEVEFVCIPRPLERSTDDDGGPVAYRLVQRVSRWEAGSAPRIERIASEGELPLLQ